MAKVTEYPRITKMKDNDILLVDGPDGTRTILQTDASKQMGGEVVMVNESAGDSTKVVINTTNEDIELATMADLEPVEEDVDGLKTQITSTDARLQVIDGKIIPTWIDGDNSGNVYYNGKRIHTENYVSLHVGATITLSDTGYKAQWNKEGGNGSAWFDSFTITVDGNYRIQIRKDPEDAAYTSISDMASKVTIYDPVQDKIKEIEDNIDDIEQDIVDTNVRIDNTNHVINITKLDNANARLQAIDGKIVPTWVDGAISGNTSYNGKRIHTNIFIPLHVGATITLSDTGYKAQWEREGASGSGWFDNFTVTVDGNYKIQIRKDPEEGTYSSIEEMASKIAIYDPAQDKIKEIEDNIDDIEQDLIDTNARIDNLNTDGGFDPDAYIYRKFLPNYYTNQSDCTQASYLDSKIYDIKNGNSFIFVTDDHWVSNAKKNIELIQYARKLTGAKIVVNGGDYLNIAATAQIAINEFTDSAGRYRAAFGKYFLPVRGNHDDNCNAGNTVLTPEEKAIRFVKPSIVYNTIFGSLKDFAHIESGVSTKLTELGLTPEHVNEMTALIDMTYYVDDEENHTRYIITNTGATGYTYPLDDFNLSSYTESWLNLPFIAEAISTIPEGYNIVLMGHMFCDAYATPVADTDGRLPTYGFVTAVCNMLTALKKKQSVTVSAPYQTGNANFLAYMDFPYTFNFAQSNNVGKMLIMMGHYHTDGVCVFDGNIRVKAWDGVSTLTQSSSTVEIPLIQVTTDAYLQVLANSPAMTIDTVTEQAFDVVTMTDDAIVCTRIGAGNDRIIPMNW